MACYSHGPCIVSHHELTRELQHAWVAVKPSVQGFYPGADASFYTYDSETKFSLESERVLTWTPVVLVLGPINIAVVWNVVPIRKPGLVRRELLVCVLYVVATDGIQCYQSLMHCRVCCLCCYLTCCYLLCCCYLCYCCYWILWLSVLRSN